jgi:ABC-type uncharacterized transport system YnjBCD ATPase subunit
MYRGFCVFGMLFSAELAFSTLNKNRVGQLSRLNLPSKMMSTAFKNHLTEALKKLGYKNSHFTNTKD